MAYVYSGKHIRTAAGGNAPYAFCIKPLATAGPAAFGRSVSSSMDVNGDGRPDLVIGSPVTSGSSTQPGYAVSELGGGGAPRMVIDPVSAMPNFY